MNEDVTANETATETTVTDDPVYIDQRIITALSPIVPDVVPLVYEGDATEWIAYNYDEVPAVAEGTAYVLRALIQVHWFLPRKTNPNAKKRQIAQALVAAGFTYPSIINAHDNDGQHWVFECEGVDGIV